MLTLIESKDLAKLWFVMVLDRVKIFVPASESLFNLIVGDPCLWRGADSSRKFIDTRVDSRR
jgi:hypothetical protein